MAKSLLPYTSASRTTPRVTPRPLKSLGLLVLGCLALYGSSRYIDEPTNMEESAELAFCPITTKLVPPPNPQFSGLSYFRSPEYKNHSLAVWGRAVRTYTPTFDDLGPVGEDSRWDVFYEYENHILESFPHLKEGSELVHVNTHGLVFIIHGSDESLAPILLTGHQDVVPVPPETESRWTYPPTSGYFDGTWLWGRGANDNKDAHTALLEGVDKLLSQGFVPKRTTVIALGFDEEIHGTQGASRISQYLIERFGKDSFFFLIDEGWGVEDRYGARFAIPGVGEKGVVEVTIDLLTSGGHSSIPPRHTAIGIMGELSALLEANPYALDLTDKSPFYAELRCMASRGTKMPKSLRESVLSMDKSTAAKKKVMETLDEDISMRFLASTSQALNIINGGMKINALPEKVTLRIDHRVGYDFSVQQVKEAVLGKVQQIADKYGLGVEAFGETAVTAKAEWPVNLPSGRFVLSARNELSPAPKSPSDDTPWEVLAGTIRHVFEDFAIYPRSDPGIDPEITVTPAMMSANTDTRYYWDLTPNIYRFGPTRSDSRIGGHAVDERVDLDAHVEGVAFFYTLLRNLYELDNK